jgi:hypothetical protein
LKVEWSNICTKKFTNIFAKYHTELQLRSYYGGFSIW